MINCSLSDSSIEKRRIKEPLALLVEHDVFRFEVSVDDAAGVEVAEGQGDLSKVEATQGKHLGFDAVTLWRSRSSPCSVLHKDPFFLQLHEELSTWWQSRTDLVSSHPPLVLVSPSLITAETLQDEVEFSSSLEGVKQVHDERVSHRLQNLSLRSCVSRVLCVTHYFSLWLRAWWS